MSEWPDDIGCEVALAARWPGHIPPGTIRSEFINLKDLAPTFCEAGRVEIPAAMTDGGSRSLLPLLTSPQAPGCGMVEPERDCVVIGRERHVAIARDEFLPYPQRAIRTADHLLILNFAPDRWPMGEPTGFEEPGSEPPPFELLAEFTHAAFADMDASPTKAWLIHHREELDVEPLYDLAFGKRPRVELYDLRADPHYMRNVAGVAAYRAVCVALEARLMAVLREHDDPRLLEPSAFDAPPFARDGSAYYKVGGEPVRSYAEARRMMVEKSAQARIPESAAERLGASAAGTNAFLRSANAGARPRL